MKSDLGRLKNRGSNNPRIFNDTVEPMEPAAGDLWVYPQRGGDYFIPKSAAESVTSSTSFQNDNDLVVELPNGIYEVKVMLSVIGATANDIKVDWTTSGTIAYLTLRNCIGPAPGNSDPSAATALRVSRHALSTAVSYGAHPTINCVIMEEFVMQSTGTGTLQMRWAQNSSGSTATTLNTSSYMTVRSLKTSNTRDVMYYDGTNWIPIKY